jgi:Rap1-interacting factor 1 N terminal
MVEPAAVSTLPLLSAARPPTPPRESTHSDSKSTTLIGRFFQKGPSSRRSSTNSNFTPESSAESPSQPAGASRKKVGFADWTEYREPPAASFDGKGQITHAVQRLPPSAERKPSKSILKPSNGSHDEEYSVGSSRKLLPPHHHATFATMLESIVQQLAGKDRSSKQDAYLMLSGSLKASDNVPDMKALKEKMPLLCQFISRDLSEKLENGNTDSTLVTKALTLLSSFLQKPAVAETFPGDFPLHIVEYGIRTLEDGTASKDILKHLMFVLAQQNFPAKIMNQERTGKLISALHQIETHVKGKSIIMGRLDVYRALLRQSKPHMVVNTAWVPDLFTDMLSSIREIRTPAIHFGLESSFILGREYNVSRAVSNLFKADQSNEDEGLKFADFYAGKLRDMVKIKELSPIVPQILSVLILFLRHKPQQLEQWAHLKLFLNVLQLCFNSSDSTTKTEANYAWNRLVFAILPSEKTPPNMRSMLMTPLVTQLKRSSRKLTLSSICNLLYYSLGPNSSAAQLDMYWDEYVVQIVGKCLVASERNDPDLVIKDATEACSILRGLFDPQTTTRPWTENRAMENLQQNTVDAKDLPAVDSKWLRKNSSRVFPMLTPLLEKMYWDLGDDSDVARLWQAYIDAIASPMLKEVTVSIDTMGCIASLFSLLYKIWNLGPKNIGSLKPCKEPSLPQSTSAFLRSFEKLVSTAIKGLGVLPFTEKMLCITHDTFVAIATPSQHPKKLRGVTKTPLQHLVALLTSTSPGLEYDQRFSQMVRNILQPFFERRTTRASQLEFIRALLSLLPNQSTTSCSLIWQILAGFATTAVDTRDAKDANRTTEQPLGAEYRDVVKILEAGINLSPQQPLPGWSTLFVALTTSATLNAGDAGRAISVIEPLAKFFMTTSTEPRTAVPGLAYLHPLLGKAAPYPKDVQALDAARRRLWGTDHGPKTSTFDPYVYLYDYVQVSLLAAYDSLSKQHLHEYADIISSVAVLLDRCPSQLLLQVLTKLQKGIACWFMDSTHRVNGGTPVSQSVRLPNVSLVIATHISR